MLALAAVLMLTSNALAAAPEPAGSEQAAPEGELFPRTPEEPEARPPRLAVGRIMLELLGGAAGGVTGVYLSYFFVVSVTRDQPGVISDPQRVIDLVGLVGMGLGSSLGVYGMGALAGGQGSYWKTLLGSSLGTALGALSILISGENTGTAMLTLASAAVGGIIAFEMSHSNGRPESESLPRARNNSRTKQVRLVFGANPRGGCFGGLVGSF
jgi:hypothetical protein